jgi:hypothetical protein
MTFNFYTFIKYFWVMALVFGIICYMTSWEVEWLWRTGIFLVMIIIFAVVESMHEDKKVLVKK